MAIACTILPHTTFLKSEFPTIFIYLFFKVGQSSHGWRAYETNISRVTALVEIMMEGGRPSASCTSLLFPKGRLWGPLGIQGTQFEYHCLKCFKKMYVIKICKALEIFSLLLVLKPLWLFN